jgi:hypothetical protein
MGSTIINEKQHFEICSTQFFYLVVWDNLQIFWWSSVLASYFVGSLLIFLKQHGFYIFPLQGVAVYHYHQHCTQEYNKPPFRFYTTMGKTSSKSGFAKLLIKNRLFSSALYIPQGHNLQFFATVSN